VTLTLFLQPTQYGGFAASGRSSSSNVPALVPSEDVFLHRLFIDSHNRIRPALIDVFLPFRSTIRHISAFIMAVFILPPHKDWILYLSVRAPADTPSGSHGRKKDKRRPGYRSSAE